MRPSSVCFTDSFPPMGSLDVRQNFKQTSLGSLSLATLPEGESKGESGNPTRRSPKGKAREGRNKLRHLIEKIRIENKLRPSPPPLGGASPRWEALEQG